MSLLQRVVCAGSDVGGVAGRAQAARVAPAARTVVDLFKADNRVGLEQ